MLSDNKCYAICFGHLCCSWLWEFLLWHQENFCGLLWHQDNFVVCSGITSSFLVCCDIRTTFVARCDFWTNFVGCCNNWTTFVFCCDIRTTFVVCCDIWITFVVCCDTWTTFVICFDITTTVVVCCNTWTNFVVFLWRQDNFYRLVCTFRNQPSETIFCPRRRAFSSWWKRPKQKLKSRILSTAVKMRDEPGKERSNHFTYQPMPTPTHVYVRSDLLTLYT